MNAPSERLQQLLFEYKLCTPSDIARCRKRVRKLVRDLPAFDSVWVDALVQLRKLTPCQARILQGPEPESLLVGPCLLVGQLGESDSSNTWLARHRSTGELCVLRIFNMGADRVSSVVTRIDQLVRASESVNHQSIVVPQACLQRHGRVVLVSRYVRGVSLRDLQIRRGRFRPDVVASIGRQLLDGLACLEQSGLVHGNIRLNGILLSGDGTPALVNTGIQQALEPEFSIHLLKHPDDCTGIAPELIDSGTATVPTPASDLYALGCVLWQLLSGRPPFPVADPLARLAQHQTGTIVDVREWSPETPDWLAQAIASFTSRDSLSRPQSFTDASQHWPRGIGARAGRLMRFTSRSAVRFDASAYRDNRRGAWPLVAALCMTIAVTALFLSGRSEKNPLMARSSAAVESVQLKSTTAAEAASTAPDRISSRAGQAADHRPQLLRMPRPDAHGRIVLDSRGPWEAVDITWPGPLHVSGSTQDQPILIVADSGVRWVGHEITLRNIHVRLVSSKSAAVDQPAMQFVAQSVTIEQCSLLGPSRNGRNQADRTSFTRTALAWRMDDPMDRSGGRCIVADTVFAGFGRVLDCVHAPQMVAWNNVLVVASGPAIRLPSTAPSGRRMAARIEASTLRGCSAVCEFGPGIGSMSSRAALSLRAGDSVFDLSGQDAAFVLFTSSEQTAALPRVELLGIENGEVNLARGGIAEAVVFDPRTGHSSAPNGLVRLESVIMGAYSFAGSMTARPTDSVVAEWRAPRRTPKPPGIDASRLAVP